MTKAQPLIYVERTYTEIVQGWTLRSHEYQRGTVQGESPNSRQTFCLDEELCVEVNKSEEGHGYQGDCASDRYIPTAVIVAAIRIQNASKE